MNVTAPWNSRFLTHPNRAFGDDMIQHAARDARRCADQEKEWIEVIDAVFRELVRESRKRIDSGAVEEVSERGIDCSAQTHEQDAPVCKRAKRSASHEHQLDAEVAGDRNVNHRWLMHGIRRIELMRENGLVGMIIRLRQSRRMQELRSVGRKLEALGAIALLGNSNPDLRRSPMAGNGHHSVSRLLPYDLGRSR